MSDNSYLLKILNEIKVNKKHIYKINELVSDKDVEALKIYFSDKPEYSVDFRKCLSCKNTWDIIIYLKDKEAI